jgi:hypothetical protein
MAESVLRMAERMEREEAEALAKLMADTADDKDKEEKNVEQATEEKVGEKNEKTVRVYENKKKVGQKNATKQQEIEVIDLTSDDELTDAFDHKMELSYGPVPEGWGVAMGGIQQLCTCPYEPSHRTGAGSFASHVRNCRKVSLRV